MTPAEFAPRFVEHASALPTDNHACICCGRRLRGRFAWLELDQRTDTFHDRGDVPEDRSQGWFPFGLTCARKKLKGAKK